MKALLSATITAALTFSSSTSANDDGKCPHKLEAKNHYKISIEIADHSLVKHEDDFINPAGRKPKNKTIPWTLTDVNELAQFIEDILNKEDKARRDDETKLDIEKSEPLAYGRFAWIEKNTGTFVVYNPNQKTCGSAYRDNNMEDHFNSET